MALRKVFNNYAEAEKWALKNTIDPVKQKYWIKVLKSYGGVELEHLKYMAVIVDRSDLIHANSEGKANQ